MFKLWSVLKKCSREHRRGSLKPLAPLAFPSGVVHGLHPLETDETDEIDANKGEYT